MMEAAPELGRGPGKEFGKGSSNGNSERWTLGPTGGSVVGR